MFVVIHIKLICENLFIYLLGGGGGGGGGNGREVGENETSFYLEVCLSMLICMTTR